MCQLYPRTIRRQTQRWHGALGQPVLRSDLYVSPSGHDLKGDGTSQYPLATIQRAVDLALYHRRYGARSTLRQDGTAGTRDQHRCRDMIHLLHDGLTIPMHASVLAAVDLTRSRMFNPDTIVINPGIYRGSGNRGIRPHGKLLTLRAVDSDFLHNAPTAAPGLWATEVVTSGLVAHSHQPPLISFVECHGTCSLAQIVDCESSGDGFLAQDAQRYMNDDGSVQQRVLVVNISKRKLLFSTSCWVRLRIVRALSH